MSQNQDDIFEKDTRTIAFSSFLPLILRSKQHTFGLEVYTQIENSKINVLLSYNTSYLLSSK